MAECGAAAECDASAAPDMATLGLSKVFILDKYFTELQKFWETEKKLQGERAASAARLELSNLPRTRAITYEAPAGAELCSKRFLWRLGLKLCG